MWTITKDQLPTVSVRLEGVPKVPQPGVGVGLVLGVTGMMTQEEVVPAQLETVPEYTEDGVTSLSPSEGVTRPKRKFGLPSYLLQTKSLTEDSGPRSVCLEVEEETGVPSLTPPTNRKGILETFRPRSKSDVTYKSKRPSFLNQLKRKNVRNSPVTNSGLISSMSQNSNAVNSSTRRPLSPLIDLKTDDDSGTAPATPGETVGEKVTGEATPEDEETSLTPRKSPEQGEFRARAASAGQQARAHVSQIVARFRNRSNTAEDKKRVRVVSGQRVSTEEHGLSLN